MPQFGFLMWMSAGLALAAGAANVGQGWAMLALACAAVGAWVMALRAAR